MEVETKIPKFRKRLSRLKRRFLKNIWLARFSVLVAVLAVLGLIFWGLGMLLGQTALGRAFSLTKAFVFANESRINSFEGATNILILGKGGAGHDAPELTDTIMVASVSYTNPSVTLLSLPRDIWMEDLRAKLNSAYYWGNQKQEGGGIILAKASVEEVAGKPVHYGLVIDLNGFEEIVDVLGGVEVDVERSFVDEKFPIAGRENDECGGDPEYRCRYETVKFEKGFQIMDGERALKFVRSRNSEDEIEGTDLARAARQQKVITALKNKVFSPAVLIHPKKALAVWQSVKNSVETDLTRDELVILARQFLRARNNVSSYVLPEDLLVVPPKSLKYDNLYVFIPRAQDFSEIHTWVDSVFP